MQARAQRLADLGGAGGSFVEGMPIIGPLAQKGAAAANAALDPLMGRGAGLPFGARYLANLAILHEAQRLQHEAHPAGALTANIAGGMMALGPLAKTVLGGYALGARGATLGARVYGGAAGGAGIGALDATLRDQDPLTGAVIGGGLGAAGPLVGNAVGAAYAAAKSALSNPGGPLAGVNPVGRQWLSTAMANETPESIAAARARMGPEGGRRQPR